MSDFNKTSPGDVLEIFWGYFGDAPKTYPEHPQDILNLKTSSKQPLALVVMCDTTNMGGRKNLVKIFRPQSMENSSFARFLTDVRIDYIII